MATWNQQGSGSFLGGIGLNNTNAPRASDANATLAMIRENNDLQRSGANNFGLQAMQGLAGLNDMYQQSKAQEREKEFQSQWGQAYANGDRNAMRQLMATYPDQAEKITGGMKGISDDIRESIGNVASGYRLAVASGKAEDFIRKNADEMRRLGIDPQYAYEQAQKDPNAAMGLADHIGMSALGMDKYYDVRDKMEGRVIERDKLAETVRSNQASEANQVRGQNLSYQSAMTGHSIAAQRLALDREIRIAETQEKVLDRKLQREKNELEREKLQQQIGEAREKSAAAKNEKLNSVVGSLDTLTSALSVGAEIQAHVDEHPTVVSRNQGGLLGHFPNLTDDTKTLSAKTDEYNMKVILPALKGTVGANPTEGERAALLQSFNNMKNAPSEEEYLKELNKSQELIIGMQKRQIKSLGIPVTKSSDEETDVKMLLSDPSLVGEYIKTYGYLPDDYYKLKRGGK
ncbi:phage DNA ejection protein [Providencia alcalifaciens]|uniref:phage DNA ejection protein n=1 Tax=Providencia alcalifaciens TaxID=126385 RepID=UPI0032DB414C